MLKLVSVSQSVFCKTRVQSDSHWKMTCFRLGFPAKLWEKICSDKWINQELILGSTMRVEKLDREDRKAAEGGFREQAVWVGKRAPIFLGSLKRPETTCHGLSCKGMTNLGYLTPNSCASFFEDGSGSVDSTWAEKVSSKEKEASWGQTVHWGPSKSRRTKGTCPFHVPPGEMDMQLRKQSKRGIKSWGWLKPCHSGHVTQSKCLSCC